MIDRFTGTAGAANLKAAMIQQRLVEHDDRLADRLIAVGAVVGFQPGDTLLKQEADDQFVFHIIAGETEVIVNERPVATRAATEAVGEMAAIDAAAPRSATIRAVTPTVCLRVAAADFVSIANEFPLMWRAAARILAERLRQRRRFHKPPNGRPMLFLGSSAEGLELAKEIQVGLKHEPIDVRLWTNGVFGPGGIPLDNLLAQVEEADFAGFVFGPDDSVVSRSKEYDAPRDNVVFELGLFLSQLGRSRTLIIKEQKADIKIPSDLLGVTPLTYVARSGVKLELQLSPLCTELAKHIKAQGAL